MDIEELQRAWEKMSKELDQQKKLTNTLIMKMTQDRYRTKFKNLRVVESIGAVFCYALALLLVLNFYRLDSVLLKSSAILSLAFLIVFPTLTLRGLSKIQKIDIVHGSYKNNLATYLKSKNYLLKLQQYGIYISFIISIASMPVVLKLVSNKNISDIDPSPLQIGALLVVLLLTIVFCKKGYKYYKNTTKSAEMLLKDLE